MLTRRNILLIANLLVIAVISLVITFCMKKETSVINGVAIAVIDGGELKSKAKCFELHKQIDKQLNEVFGRIRESELKFKEDYNKIRNNKKLSSKQRQREISKLEVKLQSISTHYNNEIQNIRQLNFRLGNYIQRNLNCIIKDIAKCENYCTVLNKETADTIIVFYNNPKIDITSKVIQFLDTKLKTLNLNNIPE